MKKPLQVSFLALVSVILLGASAFGQQDMGTIGGIVTVQDSGEPIDWAIVCAYHTDGGHWPAGMAWTDSDGNYELTVPYGEYHVKAQKWHHFTEWWEEVPNQDEATAITVDEENNPEGINFTLEPITYGGIAGTITDATTDEPIRWAWLVATSTEEPYSHRWALTNGDGEYEMELASGTYNVEASAFGYISGSLEEPVVVEEEIVAGIDFALMPVVYGSISGAVYDEDTDETIANARVRARMVDGWYGGYARSDDDGNYTLEMLRPGDYSLTAYAHGYFSEVYPEAVTVVGDENVPDIDFYLLSSEGPFDGYISGTVSDEDTAEPIADALMVAIGSSFWHNFNVRFTYSGDDGSYIFENLPPVEYKVFCMASGYLREFYDDKDSWWDADIVLPDAENVDFALVVYEPGPRFIGGQVYEDGVLVPGALVFAKQDGEIKYITFANPDGSYIFPEIDAGIYAIEVITPSLNEGFLENVVVLFSDVYDANIVLSPTSIDDDVSLPMSTALNQNYPNPFNATTNISFEIANSCNVELAVYDLLGRKVATLVSANLPAGSHTTSWNGNDSNGNVAVSGLYFYTLKTDNETLNKRMILLK